MGGIAVIGLGKGYDRNAATVADYTAIYSGLGGHGGGQTATGRYIIINAGGETVPYSDQLHALFTPQVAADHVKKGGVWVDYCGLPFRFQEQADGSVATLGPAGWSAFAENLGYGWLAGAGSKMYYPGEFTFHTQYPFRTGLPLAESLDGVCYDNETFEEPGGFLGIGGGSFPLAADGYAALFALHPPNGGYYIYAAYLYGAAGILASSQRGVPIANVVSFIERVVRNDHTGMVCRPYVTNVQHVSSPTTSPSSPTRQSSSPGPSGSKSSTTTSTSKSTTTTPKKSSSGSITCPSGYHLVGDVCVSNSSIGGSPSGFPSWVAPVGVGVAVAGILGGSAYYLIQEHRRG